MRAPRPVRAPPRPGEPEEQAPEPTAGTGIFHYSATSTYDGEWISEPAPEAASTEGAATDDDGGTPAEGDPGEGEDDGEGDGAAAGPARVRFRHGRGKLVTGDYTYEGDFERDEMHGSGVFTFASGVRYDGQWSHNAYEGRGTYVWADGTSYEGEWARGKMHGDGTYTDKDGHRWTGQFYNGQGPGLEALL